MARQLQLPDPISLPIESSPGQLSDALEGQHEESTFKHGDFTNTSFIKCTFNNVKIYDSKLSDCTIINCVVQGSLLVDCTVKTSKIVMAKIEGGNIQKSQLKQVCLMKEIWVRDCNLASCHVLGGKILRSKLSDSSITGVDSPDGCIQTSALKGCAAVTFYLNKCIVESCILEATMLNACTLVKSSTKKCNTEGSPLALRRFAPEIRAMIFSYVDLKTLLAAFHCDALLHGEIMETFYLSMTSKPFLLDAKSKVSICKLPDHVIERLETINIV